MRPTLWTPGNADAVLKSQPEKPPTTPQPSAGDLFKELMSEPKIGSARESDEARILSGLL
jgi:hypothetical protein